MKTHELAKGLIQLAKMLQSAPNIELANLQLHSSDDVRSKNQDEIKVSLVTLLQLSRIDKKQWVALVNENSFPILIVPRDSSRNILGKVLNYLESNPEAVETLKRSTTRKNNRVSSELSNALAALLKDTNETIVTGD